MEKKKQSNARYNAKCDVINIRPQKETGAEIRAAAAAMGMSLQGWILQACAEKMRHDAEQGLKGGETHGNRE